MDTTYNEADAMTQAEYRAQQDPLLCVRRSQVNLTVLEGIAAIMVGFLGAALFTTPSNILFLVIFLPLTEVSIYYGWKMDMLVIYPDRIVHKSGVLRRTENTISMQKVTDVYIYRCFGWPDRGRITVETAGKRNITFGVFSDPRTVRDLIVLHAF